IVGHYLYVANSGNQLEVWDITSKLSPTKVTSIYLGGSVADMIVKFHKSADPNYLISINNGFHPVNVIDVHNPAAPTVVSGINLAVTTSSVLYAAVDGGVMVLERKSASPSITTGLITVTARSSTTAAITGAAGAIKGTAPLSVSIKNDVTGVTAGPITVAADG